MNPGRPGAYFIPSSQAADLLFYAISANFVNTFHSLDVFVIYLLPASKIPHGDIVHFHSSACVLKCDAVDIIWTERTGNVRTQNN